MEGCRLGLDPTEPMCNNIWNAMVCRLLRKYDNDPDLERFREILVPVQSFINTCQNTQPRAGAHVPWRCTSPLLPPIGSRQIGETVTAREMIKLTLRRWGSNISRYQGE